MSHSNWGETKQEVVSLLKNPAVGNSTSAMLVALIGIITFNPGLLPYAQADHLHDYTELKKAVADQVKISNLEDHIKSATREVSKLNNQIEFNKCLDDACHFEKAQLQDAVDRRQEYKDELARL